MNDTVNYILYFFFYVQGSSVGRPSGCVILVDVTCYFISLLICCIGRSYIHHQELGTILTNYHIGRVVLGSMCVGVSVWLGWGCVCFAD